MVSKYDMRLYIYQTYNKNVNVSKSECLMGLCRADIVVCVSLRVVNQGCLCEMNMVCLKCVFVKVVSLGCVCLRIGSLWFVLVLYRI